MEDDLHVYILGRFRKGLGAELIVSNNIIGERKLVMVPSMIYSEKKTPELLIAMDGAGTLFWDGQTP
jgi:hypothetical protein